MQFKQNHFLHFIITCAVMIFLAGGLSIKQMHIEAETRDTNRLASARLIINALDAYQAHFHDYPQKLEEMKDFLQPIPVDPDSKKIFTYTKTQKGYTLIIPQTTNKAITFSTGK